MRLKEQGRNSIMLLNRGAVIAGGLILVIVSLGLGYFIGFKTGTSGHTEAERILEPPPIKTTEEKRVLEAHTKQSEQPPPPPLPSSSTAEGRAPEKNEQAPEIKVITDAQQPPADKKVTEPPSRNFNKQIVQSPSEKQEELALKKSDPAPVEKMPPSGERQQEPKRVEPKKTDTKKRADAAAKQRQFALQLGAFPSQQGAEELKKQLQAKGINAYIVKDDLYHKVRVGSYGSRKEADKNMVIFEKQTGLKGFVTAR